MTDGIRTVAELITEASIFAGLEREQIEVIAGCGRLVRVEAGEYLLHEGDPAETFFLIRSGQVALEIHGPASGSIVIETLGAGDAVGWSWLFPPYRWQMDARTVEPCSLVTIDGYCLEGKCEADHELGYQLMRRFAANAVDRLQATRLQLLDVYGRAGA